MSPDFMEMMHHSCVDDLKKYGFGETFINELVEAALRTNYGQTNKIQSFVSKYLLNNVSGYHADTPITIKAEAIP